tara:strand:- start:320 stop:1330 length:1011 start_codon:yes stop_codon:yes gene_type:complete
MCGIVAYIGKDTPINKLMYLMNDNDSRGGHSSGAIINGNVYKCLDESSNLLSIIDDATTNCFLGHTRYSTHGEITANNSHPYIYGKYAGVHNGVLGNHKENLKENELKATDVDSKAIYSILEKTDDLNTLGSHSGTINALWVDMITGKLHVYRRNNPLFKLRTEEGVIFSSKKEGLLELADEAKQVEEVTPDFLYIYNADGKLDTAQKIEVTAIEKLDTKAWYEYGNINKDGYKTTESKEDYAYDEKWWSTWNSQSVSDEEKEKEEDKIFELNNDWYHHVEHGLDNFQLAYNEMKYHGWLDEDEDESISNFILLIKQELKNENTNNDVHSSLILKE